MDARPGEGPTPTALFGEQDAAGATSWTAPGSDRCRVRDRVARSTGADRFRRRPVSAVAQNVHRVCE
ncbi:hypothetical protein SHL15_8632 [Streptomyces hygroscopicus subsp. limoneus]|nr:hypothetical protein SHL15_8632 [Streptomyces hygroscopicus subsp. limoneus]